MRNSMNFNWFYIFLISITASGCATTYGPQGLTGGYVDDQVDEETYFVSFYGNGNTDGDTVWYYWIYRCAELTKEKGYTAFTLDPLRKKTSTKGSIYQPAFIPQSIPPQLPSITLTKGGSGPSYSYVPGYAGPPTVRYSASGTIRLYKQPYPFNIKLLLRTVYKT